MEICSEKPAFPSFDSPNVLSLASPSSVPHVFLYAFKLCVLLKACTHLASITLILAGKIALLSFKSLVIALVTCIP